MTLPWWRDWFKDDRSPSICVAITSIFAVAIGIADVSTGCLPEITIFILVPVMAGTYYFGFKYGFCRYNRGTKLVAHLKLEVDAPAGDCQYHFTYISLSSHSRSHCQAA